MTCRSESGLGWPASGALVTVNQSVRGGPLWTVKRTIGPFVTRSGEPEAGFLLSRLDGLTGRTLTLRIDPLRAFAACWISREGDVVRPTALRSRREESH